jgi:hypothetical protein
MGRRKESVAYDTYAQSAYEAEYWQQEAARVVEAERQRLEMELQARLDQVGAEVELLESMNRRHLATLRRRAMYMFVLAVAIAATAGWLFTKKIKPRMDVLQSMISAQQVESDKLNAQLREQTDKARSMEENYLAARAELDRGKKPADTVKAVTKVDAPKAAAPAPAPAAKPTPPPAQPAPKAARPAPVAATPPPPPARKPCNCSTGDPMCSCL